MAVANMPVDEYWGFIGASGSEVSLQSQYWNIATWGGSRWVLPTLRGQDYEQPYRAGMQWRSKYPNSRTITLSMWTAGINQTNGVPDPTDKRLTFNNNFQQLRQLFWYRNGLGSSQGQLVRRWWLTQGGTNKIVKANAMAEIAGTMEPTMNDRLSASFAVDLLLSDPYFYGTAQSQAVTTSGGSIVNLGEGIAGEGYPSTVNSFTMTLTGGPVTVTNVTAGVSVTYGASVTHSPITLDLLNYTATDASGNNVIANITHTGSRMWMCLLPGTNVITVSTGTATFYWSPPYV